MSIAAVQEFLSKVAEDQALQSELAQVLEAENDRQAVTDLANVLKATNSLPKNCGPKFSGDRPSLNGADRPAN
jgi:hypothetical protein